MKDIKLKLSKEQKEEGADKLKKYLEDNHDIEISGLSTKLLVDFITENLGGYYYDNGVDDARRYMSEKVDELYLLMIDTGE